MPKKLNDDEWYNREKVGKEYQERLNRLRIKHRTVAENIGINLAHFHQMLQGLRPMWKHLDTIELVVSEFEEAERRIKEKLYK